MVRIGQCESAIWSGGLFCVDWKGRFADDQTRLEGENLVLYGCFFGGEEQIHRLLGQAGSAEEIYFLKKEQLEKLSGLSDRQVHAITDRKKNWDLEEKYAALGESGISFLSCEMESYPRQLKNIVDAPYSLYIKGKMPDFSKRRVAVVGARMCSEYGKAMAEQIGENLALCGAEVLSGMARGIDTAAARAALKAGKPRCVKRTV